MTGTTTSSRNAVVVGDGPLAADLADGLGARGYRVAPVAVREVSRANFVDALKRVHQELGSIDLVVHAHAHPLALRSGTVEDISERDWIDACESTLDAAYRMAQAAHAHLVESRGRLVFVVPTTGLTGAVGYAALAAAAEGIRALAKGMAKTWGRDGITVNSIAYALGADSATTTMSLVAPAFGRLPDIETDVAPVIALLASPDAHFVTGATLVLDGGIWTAL
jgi:NAD(P)-dependent dehydrogenase (short-subunit alcohol dehydrogenase family)